jgi:translation initiation factor 5B
VDEREVAEMAETEEPNIVEANDSKVTKSEAVAKTSKKKKNKNKNKSGSIAQEKDN